MLLYAHRMYQVRGWYKYVFRLVDRTGTFEVVGAHAVLPQGDTVLASLALLSERAGRLAAF